VKFSDFEIMSRSHSMPAPVAGRDELARVAVRPQKSMPLPKAVRLLGLSLSGLASAIEGESQLPLGQQAGLRRNREVRRSKDHQIGAPALLQHLPPISQLGHV
jgi:hypothetical protein